MEVHINDFSGDDTTRFRLAKNAAGANGIINLENDTTYEIDGQVKIFEGQLWKGWKSVIKRKSTAKAVVTNVVNDKIYLDSVSGFFVNDTVISVYGSVFGEHRGHQAKRIDEVGSDYIKSNITPQVGDTIIKEFNLIHKEDAGLARFEGIIFDGNIQGNSDTHDWRCNAMIRGRGGFEFYRCEFRNTPSENIVSPSTLIDSCKAKNLGGSLVHISAENYERRFTRVSNCDVDGVNLIGNAIMKHSEAAITFSNNSKNVALVGNSFTNAHHILGIVGSDDGDVIVQSNYFELTGNVIIGSQVTVGNNIVINTN